MIAYQLEPDLAPEAFVDLLVRSTLAERRPVDKPDVIRAMLKNADIILTARDGDTLVGISRAVSDFGYCVYLSDLAVDAAYQKQGIGRELIRRTHEAAGTHTHLILIAAPKASQGRSLRDLRLDQRLMKYPLSYMIYSPAFAAMPDAAKGATLTRLRAVLAGDDKSPKYAHLTPSVRQAIDEILHDTLPLFGA